MTIEQLLESATQQHRAGDLNNARTLYLQVLATAPEHGAALFRLSLLELQSGRPDPAMELIEKAITLSPDESRYQFAQGEILAALGRREEAIAAYHRFLKAEPRSADAHFSLGSALQATRDYTAAIASYQAAVECQPDHADALNNMGNCYQLVGNLEQAHAAYRRSLAIRPDFAGATANLATILLAAGEVDEATRMFRAAANLEPQAISHQVNLGAALCKQREFAQAAALLRRAIEHDPQNAEFAYNLGNALLGLGELRQAVEQYQKATTLRPDFADAFNNLGNARNALGEFTPALAAYEAAIRAKPDFVVAMNNASCVLRTLGRMEEAEALLRRDLEIDPRHSALHNNLGNVLKDTGQLNEAVDAFRKALEIDPTNAPAHSNLCYSLSFQSPEPGPILEECLRFDALHAGALQSEIRLRNRPPHHRLRIGYVSADFRDHCQSLFTIPLLANHDHSAFEIFCYSSVERPDDYTRRIAGYADVWREARDLDDAALAGRIRADEIDILVDLTMHMSNGRPLVFARKPAPIQIAWLAYPGTTGLSAMDYRLTDPRLDPPGYESHYSERTIHLPDSFWCYDPLADTPDVNALPAIERGFVSFGCLNNPCKLTDHTLHLWSGVMRALPDSRLLLMAPPGSYREKILQRLTARQIAQHRVEFVPFRPRARYLQTYHDIDIGLDTFPYNGHTTSLDSCWMGVPVITRVGQTCAGRGGLSQLFNLDLLELAAETDEMFVNIAVSLANDLPRLSALRRQLRSRLEHSALMDARGFAENIEAVYRRISKDHGRGSVI